VLGVQDSSFLKKGNEEVLSAAAKLDPDNTAQRAWLIEMVNDASLEGAKGLEEGKHYKITHKTHPYKPGAFDKNTGVYIIAHNEWGVTQVFEYFHLSLDKRIPDKVDLPTKYQLASERGAAGMAQVIKLLGINQIRKLCMAACSIATPVYQKGFLASLVENLAVAGLFPLVAGWDIPITVREDGSKEATGPHKGPLRDKRDANKFIYKFQSDAVTFSGAEKKVSNNPEKVSEALQDYAKKALEVKDVDKRKQFESALFRKNITTTPTGKGKAEVKVVFDFATRLRYSKSGWSDGT
jgi:hypothetical protein